MSDKICNFCSKVLPDDFESLTCESKKCQVEFSVCNDCPEVTVCNKDHYDLIPYELLEELDAMLLKKTQEECNAMGPIRAISQLQLDISIAQFTPSSLRNSSKMYKRIKEDYIDYLNEYNIDPKTCLGEDGEITYISKADDIPDPLILEDYRYIRMQPSLLVNVFPSIANKLLSVRKVKFYYLHTTGYHSLDIIEDELNL